MTHSLHAAILGALTLAVPQTVAAQQAPTAQAQAVQVGTITVAPEKVPLILNVAGVAVASEDAQIRPQVGGVVQQILYRSSTPMKVGDPMFQIDATSYQAALAVAEANLASANAARDEAEAGADRYGALAGRGVSQAEADTARRTLLQAEAAVAVAEADVKTAQFNLDNTTIKSPIEGQASVPEISVGIWSPPGSRTRWLRSPGWTRSSPIWPIPAPRCCGCGRCSPAAPCSRATIWVCG